MKSLFISSLIGILIVSCTDSHILPQQEEIRDYDTDAKILAQFVEVDNTTGLYVINPDKKISATDYVINRNKDELMKVNPLNRSRFEREMNQINAIIAAFQESEGINAFLYSTSKANTVVDNSNSVSLHKLNYAYNNEECFAHMSMIADKTHSVNLTHSHDMTMTVASRNNTTFYLSQLSIVDSSEADKGTIIISGLSCNSLPGYYSFSVDGMTDEVIKLKGRNMIGNGTVTVTLSR